MTTYFALEGIKERHKCFHLERYRDKHGKFYEIRRTKLPRGKVWYKLGQLEWSACHERINVLIKKIKLEVARKEMEKKNADGN